jgi:hypothetical protein
MSGETFHITFDSSEWVKELADRQKELISMIMVEDGLMLRNFVSGFMTRPVAAFEGKAFVAMSAVVEDINVIKETFKRVIDSGHKVYLYCVLKNQGCGTKTIKYAVI